MKEYRCQKRRHCSEADLPQCWYCKGKGQARPLPGSSYASIPGEILTIRRTQYRHPFGCEITSDKRTMYGAQYVYHSGLSGLNYPVPAICNHLDLIAAEPLQAWEDFNAIGWHGKYANCGKM